MSENHRQDLVERLMESAEDLNRQMHSGRLDEWEGLDMTIPQVKTLIPPRTNVPVAYGQHRHLPGQSAFGHDHGC